MQPHVGDAKQDPPVDETGEVLNHDLAVVRKALT
jgi:hypothetical protein